FSHLAHQTPTLFDLVTEKIKSDKDFLPFTNWWRTIASRSEVIIPRAQAVAMIVNNATPQLRTILMLSKLHTFYKLYNRAKIVQAQIRNLCCLSSLSRDPGVENPYLFPPQRGSPLTSKSTHSRTHQADITIGQTLHQSL